MATLDIRWPLGSIFVLIGAILMLYGWLSGPATIDAGAINVWWGGLLLLFGACMLLLARKGPRA